MRQMLNIDWKSEIQDKSPEEAYNIFLNKYNQAVEECVPKSSTKTSNKYEKPIWMKSETLKLIKKKHNSLTRYLNTNQQQDYDRYKEIRNKVTVDLERLSLNRTQWRSTYKAGVETAEALRVQRLMEKRESKS